MIVVKCGCFESLGYLGFFTVFFSVERKKLLSGGKFIRGYAKLSLYEEDREMKETRKGVAILLSVLLVTFLCSGLAGAQSTFGKEESTAGSMRVTFVIIV